MERLNIGKIVGTHGIKGEVKVLSNSHFLEERFKKGNQIYISNQKEEYTLTIKSLRFHKGVALVLFEGLENINFVEKYKGFEVYSDIDSSFLEEDEHYYYQLIGCKILTTDNKEIGVVTSIIEGINHDILVVERKNKKDALIPYIRNFIIEEDIENKTMILQPIKGLIDED